MDGARVVGGETVARPPGCSTNLPLQDLDRDGVPLVLRWNGQPLDPEQGGPLRLLVPYLYAWKICKCMRGLIFMDQDRPGYWERLEYHMRGDPMREERHSGRAGRHIL